MAESVGPVKVLSIVGPGRSGTTMLAAVLGELEGFTTTGELRWLWERGIVQGRPCACGKAPKDCVVWAPVIDRTCRRMSAGPSPATLRGLVTAQHEVSRLPTRRRLLREPGGTAHGSGALRAVRAATGSAFREFADVTGSRVVVDSSKRPVDAAVLANVECVDDYVLHIVRDPRAVVHSWQRAKTFSVGGVVRQMGTRRMSASVRRWISNCLDAEKLREHVSPERWLEMRYEDFAGDPQRAIAQILDLLGEHGAAPVSAERTVWLHPNHMVAGNPSRFTTGRVEIRPDQAWRTEMSTWAQRSVAAATLPLLRRYHYPLFPR